MVPGLRLATEFLGHSGDDCAESEHTGEVHSGEPGEEGFVQPVG